MAVVDPSESVSTPESCRTRDPGPAIASWQINQTRYTPQTTPRLQGNNLSSSTFVNKIVRSTTRTTSWVLFTSTLIIPEGIHIEKDLLSNRSPALTIESRFESNESHESTGGGLSWEVPLLFRRDLENYAVNGVLLRNRDSLIEVTPTASSFCYKKERRRPEAITKQAGLSIMDQVGSRVILWHWIFLLPSVHFVDGSTPRLRDSQGQPKVDLGFLAKIHTLFRYVQSVHCAGMCCC